MGRQSKYPEEFRRKAAALVLDSGRSVRDVGRELGVNHETLRNWVQALPPGLADPPRTGDGGVLLHRGLLQPTQATLKAEQPQPRRLRTHDHDTDRGVRLT